MTDREPDEAEADLSHAWQEQTPEEEEFVIDEATMKTVSQEAHRLERGVERRNVLEWLAAAFVTVLFAWRAISSEEVLTTIGNGIIVVGAVWIGVTLVRRGRNVEPPTSVTTASFVAYYRRQLERQQHLLATVPQWYLGPMAVGMAFLLAGSVRSAWLDGSLDDRALPIGISAGIIIAVLGSVAWLNRRGAAKLRRQLEELDAPPSGPGSKESSR